MVKNGQGEIDSELVDSDNRFIKIGNNAKQFIGNLADKISNIPDFAKDILSSTDISEQEYREVVKQDKSIIVEIIKKKLESKDHSIEELKDLLNRNEENTEKIRLDKNNQNKFKKEMLLIVGLCTIMAIKLILENRK